MEVDQTTAATPSVPNPRMLSATFQAAHAPRVTPLAAQRANAAALPTSDESRRPRKFNRPVTPTPEDVEEQSTAEQSRSRARQTRAEQSTADHSRAQQSQSRARSEQGGSNHSKAHQTNVEQEQSRSEQKRAHHNRSKQITNTIEH